VQGAIQARHVAGWTEVVPPRVGVKRRRYPVLQAKQALKLVHMEQPVEHAVHVLLGLR
jgi:hypothetical protein